MKDFDELTLQDDFMFGIVMRRPKLCQMCLERILNKKIVKLEFPESQKIIDVSVVAKSIRLDVYCEGEDAVYNIEMQRTDFISERGRYYQGLIDLNLIDKGQHYSELKNNLVIFICTFDKYEEGRHLYTFENRCIQDPNIRYGDGTQKIVLNTKGVINDIPLPLKNFLDYIDHGAVTDEYTDMLDKEVISTKNNEKWRLDYMTFAMKINDAEYFAEKRGIDIGDFNRTKAFVYRLYDKGYMFDQIMDLTGISQDECQLITNMYDIDHNNALTFYSINMVDYVDSKKERYNPVNESIVDQNDPTSDSYVKRGNTTGTGSSSGSGIDFGADLD